jgi:hypothetical protein
MKIVIVSFLVSASLFAGLFSSNDDDLRQLQKNNEKIHQQFRQNVNDANAIIKRGEYSIMNEHKSNILNIITRIDTLSIPKEDKKTLQNDMTHYAVLVDDISVKLQSNAPKLNQHYSALIANLKSFNSKLASIGLSELLNDWHEISRIKNRYVKKPSKKHEKEFSNKWTSMVITITELYLDEEDEEALFAYLENYKAYFQEISAAYSSVGYANINKLKPLTYKIKAQLELSVPYQL